MSKSIQETHPFFARVWSASVGMPLDGADLKEAVQRTTVDVAEHERLKAEVEHYKSELVHANVEYGEMLDNLRAEVERLKKELEEVKGSWLKPSTVSERCRSSFNNGLAEGERRSAAEVELLKKDFSGQLKKAKRAGNYAFNNGVVEGERRAMERVISVLKFRCDFSNCVTRAGDLGEYVCDECKPFYNAIGLGGEEKR